MVQTVKELYQYRELLANLVKRELKVKYKRSVLGFFWSFLNPLLTMLVFTFVFSFVLRISPPKNSLGMASFPMFLLTALLPWNFFSLSLGAAVGSIVYNSNLIRKVYFPREILPISLSLANLINFFFELVVLFLFLLFLGYPFLGNLYYLVLIIFIELVFIIGISLMFAFLNVYFRDVQHFVGIILMVWFYATPIIYPDNLIPAVWRGLPTQTILRLNPLTALVLCYRDVLYFGRAPNPILLGYSAAVSVATLVVAYTLFKRYEPSFAEEV
jgi:ABC-2 type transport system permease protein